MKLESTNLASHRWLFVCLSVLTMFLAFAPAWGADQVSYSKQIKPLIEANCLECHSSDKPKSLFDMTSIATMKHAGRKAGPGIVAHAPDKSAIIQYITGVRKPRMPKGEDALSVQEIQLFRDWIAAGAPDDSAAATPALVTSAPTTNGTTPQEVVEHPSAEELKPIANWNGAEQVAIRRYLRMQLLPPSPEVPKVDGPINNAIDAFIVAQWANVSGPTGSIVPALCDDATFVRRVYLDLIGMIPTDKEARQFVEDEASDKRAKLIDALLNRTDDYAAAWVPFWEDALCSNGNHQGGVGTHGNYRNWLLANFKQNKPFDVMVSELLDPTMPNNPGRYVLNQDHTRTVQSASDTAQVFMGTAIKCASCHNHFENAEWPQTRAAAFAGFFGPADLELIRCERKSGKFVPTSFLFDLPQMSEGAPEGDTNARLKRVTQLIVDPTNPRFAPTMVNRLWKRYLGLGLSEPVDDYREDRTLNHSPLLAWLADDFIRSGYDIKHTIRLITNSRTYQLQYNPKLEDSFDVAKQNEPRFYRSPGLRRLTAEQLLDSIRIATGEPTKDLKRTFSIDESTVLTRALGRPASRNEVSTNRPEDTAIVQALELMNGQEYADRIYQGPIVAQLASVADVSALVTQMYWSALNRPPTPAELETASDFLGSSKSASTQPSTHDSLLIGDMLWALLTSPEFQYIR